MSVVRFFRPAAVILGLVIATAPHTFDRPRRPAEPPPADGARIQDRFGKLPLSFIENRGQVDERVAYTLRSPGHTTYFTPDGLTLRLTQGKGEDARAHTIKVDLVGAATDRVESRGRAPGVVSYFRGSRDQWKTAIPTHESIGYVQPWPGIDLAYRGQEGRLESVYTVAPHADPARIKLRYSGQTSLALDDDGNLVLTSSVGDVRETAPIVYQEIDTRRVPVEARYALLDENTVAFDVAKYDPDHALIIDPMLEYAGFIGGSGTEEGRGIAVDSAGNAYVTGFTSSTESDGFPVTVGPDLTYNGGLVDAFVAKVSADGSTLAYIGYIGGSLRDEGKGIAVDSGGNAYVTGRAQSTEAGGFPVTVGPDLTHNASDDAFVAKVSADGTTLIYCGYIGGSGAEWGFGIAVDGFANAYVTGWTNSTETTFPEAVGPDLTLNGGTGAFVAKVSTDGSALVYAGYIGGSPTSGLTEGNAIAVDGGGNAYVTGVTSNTEAQGFPVTVGPDLTHNGGDDAYVAKVSADGSALVYAGYIGGSGDEPNVSGSFQGSGIAVDSSGNAYVTGSTQSSEATFPVLVGPDLVYNGIRDAYVAKVMADGSALAYAGYIGTGGGGRARAIAVDSAGSAYVTGMTLSGLAATVGPDLTYNFGDDAYVAKVTADGSALVYSGYIGGSGDEEGWGIAVDNVGNAYVTGDTSSSGGFPVTVGPDLSFGGAVDVFVVKIVPSVNTAPVAMDDTASAPEDTPVAIPIATLLANDTDADLDTLTLIAVTQGTNGSVAIVGTDVVYTPAMGFVGMDSFDYTIEDPSNATAMATVTVTVTAVGGADGGDGGAVADLGATPDENGGGAKDGGDAKDGGSSPDPDAGPMEEESEGCGCALGRSPRSDPRALWLIALVMLCRRRR